MSELFAEQTPSATDTVWAEIASRLLELQQKLDAWDRLYKEEWSELRKELSRLTAHYIRRYQTQRPRGQLRRDQSTDAQRDT
jgi:hypothetical protein